MFFILFFLDILLFLYFQLYMHSVVIINLLSFSKDAEGTFPIYHR
jgi:hypothetical protein